MDIKQAREPEPQRQSKNIDVLAALCEECNVTIGDGDGLFLIRTLSDGQVIPTVLRLGKLTPGRLEGAMRGMFHTVNQALQAQRLKEEKDRRNDAS